MAQLRVAVSHPVRSRSQQRSKPPPGSKQSQSIHRYCCAVRTVLCRDGLKITTACSTRHCAPHRPSSLTPKPTSLPASYSTMIRFLGSRLTTGHYLREGSLVHTANMHDTCDATVLYRPSFIIHCTSLLFHAPTIRPQSGSARLLFPVINLRPTAGGIHFSPCSLCSFSMSRFLPHENGFTIACILGLDFYKVLFLAALQR